MADTLLVEVIGERYARELLKALRKLRGSKTDHIGKLLDGEIGGEVPADVVTQSQELVTF